MGDVVRYMPCMLTVCGVWETSNLYNLYIILPWSSFAADKKPLYNEGVLLVVNNWVIRRFNDSTLALHVIS